MEKSPQVPNNRDTYYIGIVGCMRFFGGICERYAWQDYLPLLLLPVPRLFRRCQYSCDKLFESTATGLHSIYERITVDREND